MMPKQVDSIIAESSRLGGLSLVLALFAVGCIDQAPDAIAHRIQGVGPVGENVIENAPIVLRAGYGLELDIRGDGERDFELGHNFAEGHNLDDTLRLVEEEWEADMAGLPFIIDIANDEQDKVSNNLMDYLQARIPGTPLNDLDIIIQSSSLQALTRMRSAYDTLESTYPMKTGFTVWTVVEYTPPAWLDYVVTNVNEIGSFAAPKPYILFGVADRSSYQQARYADAEVPFVLTDHPRRVRAWQD